MLIRQGDVLIRQIDKLPEGLKKLNHTILAWGEATGHHHKLVAERENLVQLFEDENGQMYFKVDAPTALTHQEHKELTIPAGIYVVGNEREFDYFLNEIRRVQD